MSTSRATLLEAIRNLFTDQVAVGLAGPGPHPRSVSGREEALIMGAIGKRQEEFRAGRACAKVALAELGLRTPEIGRTADRLPVWPAGVVGSISHCEGLCAAVVARDDEVCALGFDAEVHTAFPDEIAPMVAHRDEVAVIAGPTGLAVNPYALVFSAKEAFYKSYFPRERTYLDFHDVRLTLQTHDPCSGTFRAELVKTGAPGQRLARRTVGRWRMAGGFLLCGAYAEPE